MRLPPRGAVTSLTRFIPPLLIAAATGGAEAIGQWIDKQPISITSALGLTMFVGSACLWLERRYGKISETMRQRISDLEIELGTRLTRIETEVRNLPCPGRGGGCDDEDDPRRKHHKP